MSHSAYISDAAREPPTSLNANTSIPFRIILSTGACLKRRKEAIMAIKDANWFSNLYGWRTGNTGTRDIDRAHKAAVEIGRPKDEPAPAARRAWRTLLGQSASHPHIGRP
jgi:hypothetical protein